MNENFAVDVAEGVACGALIGLERLVLFAIISILTNFCAPPIAPPTRNHGLQTSHNQRSHEQMELTGGFSVRHWYRNNLPRNPDCS